MALELMAGDKSLVVAALGNFHASYLTLTPGTVTFNVRKAGDENGSIRRFPVALKADSYTTVLVTNKEGKPTVEVVDDTVDPQAPDTLRLTVRQLMPNARVSAYLGSTLLKDNVGYGETAVVDPVPASTGTLTVQAMVLGQRVKLSSMPLDLTKSHHETLLILPDPYGGFVANLSADGTGSDDRARESDRR